MEATCPEPEILRPLMHPRAQPSGCRAWEQRRRRPSRSVRRFCRGSPQGPLPCICPWSSTASRTNTGMCRFSAASTGRSECSGGGGRWARPRGCGQGGVRPWASSCDRAKAALGLERQIRDADKVIRGFESALAQEAPIPAGPGALQERVSELKVRGWAASWQEWGCRLTQELGGKWRVGLASNRTTRVRCVPSCLSAGGGSCWSSRPVCSGYTAS